MKKYHVAYLCAALVFCGLDYVWLTGVAASFYQAQLGHLLAKPDMAATVAFYLIYILGIVVFCVHPAVRGNRLATAFLHGALLGLVAYGSYDLSNFATLKGWPLRLSVIDMVWGMLLTSVAASAGFLATRWVYPPTLGKERRHYRRSAYAR
jgi:uncharacterized membrane protein